ncbi:ribose-phosphate pyrophosphokinase [Sphingomonas sp. YR710]|uniref:ribose-phosphate diphosphokinase n=1 Tax=Sphingomonas sp. YR710 TaxID=1882773 RepID=UPI000889B956|nr:ribose-phosphate diphosphokinase [Sphingomonas sp. YR710]SDD80556.1 ribose-phosphate pyrophosphokinase [Sphingomonas sp. YR710]
MASSTDLILFALDASRNFGEAVACHIGRSLAAHEERDFDGGEHKTRPLVEVAGRSVFVIQNLDGDTRQSANDKLIRLLFFAGTLKDAGAARVTAVTPYLAYSRKDRRTKPRDPVSSRYVATLFEAMRIDCVLTCEVHNLSAFENAFRSCRPEHVSTAELFADHFAGQLGDEPIAVVSPDSGGDRRAELFRKLLEKRIGRSVGKAVLEKHRSMGIVSGTLFAGDVGGRTAIIIDDLISSGTTIIRAAQACRDAGATRVIAAATHGLFTGGAPALFGPEGPDEVIVTNILPVIGLPGRAAAKLKVVSVAGLVGDVIACLHAGGAVVDLLPYD